MALFWSRILGLGPNHCFALGLVKFRFRIVIWLHVGTVWPVECSVSLQYQATCNISYMTTSVAQQKRTYNLCNTWSLKFTSRVKFPPRELGLAGPVL